ncbi:hypothetical protein [Liberiplasma polymorphum]|uniref:hypothetical protein n=1 Tax=Liberiplasma polymorphum TaxID=3374570 RepID=UPI003776847D
MNEERYYLVEAKCGHVGRSNYIVKTFAVKADSGKKAAKFTRQIPRVKHHLKSAIVSTKQVSENDYYQQIQRNNNDPYFMSTNKQQQNRLCEDLHSEIKELEKFTETPNSKRKSVRYRLRKIQLQMETYGGSNYGRLQRI